MRQILKQSSWLLMAQVLTRFIGFFYTIFLARNLGVLDFGLYSLGLAYFSIISSLADFGFNRFLIREISKEKAQAWEIIWNVLMLRLTIVSILFAIFALSIYIFDSDKIRVSVILLASLAVLPQAIAITFDGMFIALQKLQFSGISAIALSFSTVVFGLFLINKGLGVYGAVNALILGQVVYAAVLGLILYKHQGFSLSLVTVRVIKKALLGSLPYGLLGVIGFTYFRIDTILLAYLKGSFEVGIYGVAYRFLETAVYIPSSLSLAIFPILVKMHSGSNIEIKKMFNKIIISMGLLGLVVAGIYLLILPSLIRIFLPNFLSSIDAVKILSFSIPFIFIYVPLSQIVLTTEKYLRQLITLTIGTLFFNIILNFLLIPKFGFLGASFVTVASDILSLIVIILFIRIKVFRDT